MQPCSQQQLQQQQHEGRQWERLERRLPQRPPLTAAVARAALALHPPGACRQPGVGARGRWDAPAFASIPGLLLRQQLRCWHVCARCARSCRRASARPAWTKRTTHLFALSFSSTSFLARWMCMRSSGRRGQRAIPPWCASAWKPVVSFCRCIVVCDSAPSSPFFHPLGQAVDFINQPQAAAVEVGVPLAECPREFKPRNVMKTCRPAAETPHFLYNSEARLHVLVQPAAVSPVCWH